MTTSTPTAPTQVTHPGAATARTILQAVAGAILTAATVVATLAVFAPQFLTAIADILPPEWLAWATGAVAAIGAFAGALARVMAIPGVNAWLTTVKLGAAGKHEG
jgi:protein-S-isoprenylcysteine O-methyltransferase Ste14